MAHRALPLAEAGTLMEQHGSPFVLPACAEMWGKPSTEGEGGPR
jgi:hypothetical protein